MTPARSILAAPPALAAAFAAAEAAGARGEAPIGAAIRDPADGAILAVEGNRDRERCDPTAHAEMLAIRAACAARGKLRLTGLELWVTLEPCAMCAAAISFARIGRLYFAAEDAKGGGVVHGPRFFDQPTCHWTPEVYAGLGEARAAALLRDFFRARR